MKFTSTADVINFLIKKLGFTSYLEIGLHRGETFNHVGCRFKVSVDPSDQFARPTFKGGSDEFFEYWLDITNDPDSEQNESFQIILIDGLHHADQVKRDFENSLKCLNSGGFILIHDTNPEREEFACEPRNGLRGRWNGSVYKFMWDLLAMAGIEYRTLDFDANGLTVVRRKDGIQSVIIEAERNFENFNKDKERLLQLCTTEQFLEWIS